MIESEQKDTYMQNSPALAHLKTFSECLRSAWISGAILSVVPGRGHVL